MGPEDAISLHLSLKYQGQEKFTHQVTGPCIQKCREKASILILIDMYGKDKKWMELQKEISQQVMDVREARGAGTQPAKQKFNKDYITEGSDLSKVISSKSVAKNST